MLRRVNVRVLGPITPGTLEWNRMHHLNNSLPVGTPFVTKCGRTFCPILYQEMINAMADQRWLNAIQKGLRHDAEYQTMLKTRGGGGLAFDDLCKRLGHQAQDQEVFDELKLLLETDDKASLSMCAMLDSFEAIKEKRDHYKTEMVAEGRSHEAGPYGLAQKGQEPFGSSSRSPGF